eukprot:COSAG05_NODE_5733_length_1102_cov_1.294118_1_plen_152_part_00
MAIPTKVFGLAAAVAFALLILILGCIFEEKWWSLFTAVCYLVAGTSWLLFQPGIWLAASRAVGWHNSTRGSLHNSAQCLALQASSVRPVNLSTSQTVASAVIFHPRTVGVLGTGHASNRPSPHLRATSGGKLWTQWGATQLPHEPHLCVRH